jgi:hypothetical protein
MSQSPETQNIIASVVVEAATTTETPAATSDLAANPAETVETKTNPPTRSTSLDLPTDVKASQDQTHSTSPDLLSVPAKTVEQDIQSPTTAKPTQACDEAEATSSSLVTTQFSVEARNPRELYQKLQELCEEIRPKDSSSDESHSVIQVESSSFEDYEKQQTLENDSSSESRTDSRMSGKRKREERSDSSISSTEKKTPAKGQKKPRKTKTPSPPKKTVGFAPPQRAKSKTKPRASLPGPFDSPTGDEDVKVPESPNVPRIINTLMKHKHVFIGEKRHKYLVQPKFWLTDFKYGIGDAYDKKEKGQFSFESQFVATRLWMKILEDCYLRTEKDRKCLPAELVTFLDGPDSKMRLEDSPVVPTEYIGQVNQKRVGSTHVQYLPISSRSVENHERPSVLLQILSFSYPHLCVHRKDEKKKMFELMKEISTEEMKWIFNYAKTEDACNILRYSLETVRYIKGCDIMC